MKDLKCDIQKLDYEYYRPVCLEREAQSKHFNGFILTSRFVELSPGTTRP